MGERRERRGQRREGGSVRETNYPAWQLVQIMSPSLRFTTNVMAIYSFSRENQNMSPQMHRSTGRQVLKVQHGRGKMLLSSGNVIFSVSKSDF